MTEAFRPEAGDAATDPELQRVLDKLVSLHDGDRGVLDVVAYGPGVLPALRRLLFKREASGLYQPQCHVVEALAALGAHDILIDFLASPHGAADPVEAAGEEAVLNAAARALDGVSDGRIFPLLLSLAKSRCLAGPIEVLGHSGRIEALPCLTAALADDLARPAAEDALRCYSELAVPGLLFALHEAVRVDGAETESSRRKRRAALALLLDLKGGVLTPPDLRAELMHDEDAVISVRGSRLVLACGSDLERRVAVCRLIDCLPQVSWLLRMEIEDCLFAHAATTRPIIAQDLSGERPDDDDRSPKANTQRALLKVAARVGV